MFLLLFDLAYFQFKKNIANIYSVHLDFICSTVCLLETEPYYEA